MSFGASLVAAVAVVLRRAPARRRLRGREATSRPSPTCCARSRRSSTSRPSTPCSCTAPAVSTRWCRRSASRRSAGRCAQPIAVLVVVLAGGGVVAATLAWAAVQFVWVVPAAHRVHSGCSGGPNRSRDAAPRARVAHRSHARSSRTACRARSARCSRSRSLWMDTLIIVGDPRHDRGRHLRGRVPAICSSACSPPKRSCRCSDPRISALLAVRRARRKPGDSTRSARPGRRR